MEKPTRAEHTVAKQYEYAEANAAADNAWNSTYYAIMTGNDWYTGFIDGILGGTDLSKSGIGGDFSKGNGLSGIFGDLSSILGDGGTIGKVGEVGKINEPVTLDEEDVRLMLDISKARTINRFSTLRPSLTAQFGDVRETADVTKIMDALEEIIQTAAASHRLVDSEA